MKIAIYGDSFGEILNNQHGKHCWVQRLKNQYPEVTLFARSGTSLFWSYELLLRTYQEFDKIIFLATQPNRLSILESPESTPWFLRERLRDDNLPMDLRQKFKSLLDYFVYVSTDNNVVLKESLFFEMLVERISKLPVPTLIIPAFEVNYLFGPKKLGLHNISMMEESHWGKKWNRFFDRKHSIKFTLSPGVLWDHRQCHMTNQNNAILFDKITNILPTMEQGTELTIDLADFVPPDSFENYIYPLDSLG
jgi:hypothetical protein